MKFFITSLVSVLISTYSYTQSPINLNLQLWADVLTADAAEAFAEAPGGFYDKELAKKMVANLFSPCNSLDPAEAYRNFRGRDASINALMRDRGFPVVN